jgi:hypothetical protein
MCEKPLSPPPPLSPHQMISSDSDTLTLLVDASRSLRLNNGDDRHAKRALLDSCDDAAAPTEEIAERLMTSLPSSEAEVETDTADDAESALSSAFERLDAQIDLTSSALATTTTPTRSLADALESLRQFTASPCRRAIEWLRSLRSR